MKAIERFKKYRDYDLDKVLIDIRSGSIESGKYSHLIKIDNNKKMKGKVLFNDGKSNSDE